jgi:hypothetical protein
MSPGASCNSSRGGERGARSTTGCAGCSMRSMDGRVPLWVPTVYSDFEPVYPIGAGDLAIDVKRCGYTNLGGPGPQREYILIQALKAVRAILPQDH